MKQSTEELTLEEIDQLAQTLRNVMLDVYSVPNLMWRHLLEEERDIYRIAVRALILKLQVIGAERVE
jgi:hypothetical protein